MMVCCMHNFHDEKYKVPLNLLSPLIPQQLYFCEKWKNHIMDFKDRIAGVHWDKA